jgi:hypothetical protein
MLFNYETGPFRTFDVYVAYSLSLSSSFFFFNFVQFRLFQILKVSRVAFSMVFLESFCFSVPLFLS